MIVEEGTKFSFPKFLYRFRSSDTPYFLEELEKSFKSKLIYCSFITGQNDPFDAYPVFKDINIKQTKEFLRKQFGTKPMIRRESLEEFFPDKRQRRQVSRKLRSPLIASRVAIETSRRQVLDFRRRTKIACLSERWNSVLMWSHYTNSHRGICLEYEVSFPSARDSLLMPMPVSYKSKRTFLDTLDLMRFIKGRIGSEEYEKSYGTLSALLLEKSDEWAYEKEWRVHVLNDGPPGYFPFPNLKPTRVILGESFKDTDIGAITKIIPKKM